MAHSPKINRRNFIGTGMAAIGGCQLLSTWALAQTGSPAATDADRVDPLRDGFFSPPQAARPRVWWHWLNGAISQEGIRLDLEWMERSGIGGVQIFNGAMPSNNRIVTPSVAYMSPEWQVALRSAVRQATAKGMEVGIATSAGWSQTGAPFVKPVDAMKKLVWTETEFSGGRHFSGTLSKPSDISGPFDAVAVAESHTLSGEALPPPPSFYADSRVIAYRIPENERPLPIPRVSYEAGIVSAEALFAGKFTPAIELPRPTKENPVWVRFDYPEPVTLRSLTAILDGKAPAIASSAQIPARLEVSDDGSSFRKVVELAIGAFSQNTNSFPPVTGSIFRVVFQPDKPVSLPADVMNMAPGALFPASLPSQVPARTMQISQLTPSGDARVNRFEEKAGFASLPDYYAVPTHDFTSPFVTPRSDVIDITSHMRPDGQLEWFAPEGQWRVLRMGYSLTGKTNGPAEAAATGLEVDKLSAPRVRAYMETYLNAIASAVTPDLIGPAGISASVSDSIEAGFGNWTDDILEQFIKRRGYDPTSMLPTLTGRIVGSGAESDGFLYDFRRTLMDLLAEAHYGEVAAAAGRRRLTVYGEALEAGNRPSLGDDIAMRSHTDVPMGALWNFRLGQPPKAAQLADVKGAASVAHLYGRTYVGAESMTSMLQPWAASPRDLKHIADTEFALGVNRICIHSSVHQPLVGHKPGVALWIFGQYFNRNESWAEQAGPWVDYLARTSWMLSQGQFVADVAYFYGEEAPIVTLSEQGKLADVPTRYGYDFVNADVLLSLLSVENGKLTLPSGMCYEVLQLGGTSERMTLPVLRKLRQLVASGAVISGRKPICSPSLADNTVEFARLADQLWSGGRETPIGKGRVIANTTAEQALERLGIMPDQEIFDCKDIGSLRCLHRKFDNQHVWFVSNGAPTSQFAKIAFRVTGLDPELWNAETGESRPLSYRMVEGRTIIPLDLDESGAALIVFRKPATRGERDIASPSVRVIQSIDGHWMVRFQEKRGAPKGTQTMQLGSWTSSVEPGIRYFSGTAIYTKTIELPIVPSGDRVFLSLGQVGDIAEILVNDHVVQTLWRPPFRTDITNVVKIGANELVIRVTNRWVNRLIGDAQFGAPKVTWTVAPVYDAKAPLLPSGLLGPVMIEVEQS